MKFKFKKSILINTVIAVITALCVFFASRGEFLKRVELYSSDILFRLSKPLPSKYPIAIIEIADADIAKIGRWPWKRKWHAAIIKVLSDLGAKAVYFDILFSEPSDDIDDSIFEESLKATRTVYLPYVFPERPYNVKDTLMPIERFLSYTKGTGSLNVYPDSDGTIRQVPLLFSGEGGTYPHVTLKIAMDYMGLKIKSIGQDTLILSNGEKDIKIPLVGDKSLIINWAGKWAVSFKHYSFIDVLAAYQDKIEGKAPPIELNNFKNAICLIGLTGFGLYDIKPVPMEPEYPGIGIIANTINTLLENRFFYVPPAWGNMLLLLLFALLPSFLISGKNPLREVLVVFLVGVAYFVSILIVFNVGIKVNLFIPLLGLFSSYITVGTYNFVLTAIEKQSLFGIAVTDGLTGLCNIRYFKILLETEIKMTRSGISKDFVVVLSDIDHFKNFNDTYGHQVGDLVLKEVANTLKSSVRAQDIVARYGGEEIIVLLKNTELKNGIQVTEKMRANLEANRFSDENNQYSVTASFGVASYQPDDTVDSIIKRSDEGLYKSKEDGRNRVSTIET